MANQITDGRTLVDSAENVNNYVGSTSPADSTAQFIQGTQSIGEQLNNSERYVMYNYASTQNLANNVIYVWINCGVVGLLLAKASGGFKIRVAGASVSDYKEWNVGGNDSWPTAVQGGWVQFVVDLEQTADGAGGSWTTTQANTAIQHIGYAATTSSMTIVGDNCWMDEIRRLPDGTAGIKVEGRNGGTTDWTFADINTQLGVTSGCIKPGPGGSWVLNAAVQFGENDTSTHGFSDTNQIILWDDQATIPTDHYKISVIGNTGGTTNFQLGTKSGTGDAAVGSQGCTIAAGSTGVRWGFDADDPNIDSCNLYGCSFIHAGDFQLDDPAVEVISSLYIDCTSATVSNSLQLRNSVVNANTADGVAFMTTDDMTDIRFCSFQFSDGHGVQLTTPRVASQTSKGNTFTGYGITTSNDAAVYNNSGGAVDLTVTDNGDSPTYRDGTSASTNVIAGAVTTKVTAVTTSGTAIQSTRVFLKASNGTGPFPFEATVTITNSGTTASVSHTAHGMANNDKVVISGASLLANNGVFTISNVTTNGYDYTMGSTPGSSPTGTIKSTYVALEGTTDVNGEITMSRVFSSDQPVTGSARKSSASPYYKSAAINGTIDSATGLNQSAVLILDE